MTADEAEALFLSGLPGPGRPARPRHGRGRGPAQGDGRAPAGAALARLAPRRSASISMPPAGSRPTRRCPHLATLSTAVWDGRHGRGRVRPRRRDRRSRRWVRSGSSSRAASGTSSRPSTARSARIERRGSSARRSSMSRSSEPRTSISRPSGPSRARPTSASSRASSSTSASARTRRGGSTRSSGRGTLDAGERRRGAGPTGHDPAPSSTGVPGRGARAAVRLWSQPRGARAAGDPRPSGHAREPDRRALPRGCAVSQREAAPDGRR